MDINFIEIMLSDYTTYKIENNNIVDCFCDIEEDKVEDTDMVIKDIPIVKSLILIIKDLSQVIPYDNDDFDITNGQISQIAIYKKNGSIVSGYVDLGEDERNLNQKIYEDTKGNIYLTIELLIIYTSMMSI